MGEYRVGRQAGPGVQSHCAMLPACPSECLHTAPPVSCCRVCCRQDQAFNIVDIKPQNMEDLTEVRQPGGV